MFRTTRTRVIGLALVGAVALSGGIYATTALAAGGPSAQTAATQVGLTGPEWRSAMLDMLEDHMGITGGEAEEFADEMFEHMQGIADDTDIQEMVDWCTQRADDGEFGPGMMNGYGWGYGGWGMMDGDDATYGGYGMMGDMMQGYDAPGQTWHMMGGYSTSDAGPAQQGSDAPNPSGPEESNPGSALGGMMGDTPTDRGPDTPVTEGRDFTPGSGGMMGSGMMGSGMMSSGMMGR